MKAKISSIALWVVAGLSLAINIALVFALLSARSQLLAAQEETASALTGMSDVLEDLKNGTFDYTVSIDQDMPIKGNIPVSFTVTVPIKTTIPINTSVSVPVTIPYAGTTNVYIPIRANVPIDLTVEVPVEQIIPIDITVPVQLEVPISIRVADTPLAQNIIDLQAVLESLAASLLGNAPALPEDSVPPAP